jgi:microcompartment protein CcmK/EutM
MHVAIGDVVGATIEQPLLLTRGVAAVQVAASPSS